MAQSHDAVVDQAPLAEKLPESLPFFGRDSRHPSQKLFLREAPGWRRGCGKRLAKLLQRSLYLRGRFQTLLILRKKVPVLEKTPEENSRQNGQIEQAQEN